jgi:hypothetical protein
MPIDALAFLRQLSRHATSRIRAGLRALSFAQRDRNGSHVGACLRPYRDRLPVTLGRHVEAGSETGASHIRHDLRTAGVARNISRHTAVASAQEPDSEAPSEMTLLLMSTL